MYTLSPETIRLADRLATEEYGISELQLMKNAAKSCVGYILPLLSSNKRIVILCGKGNNGGDGYEIARILHKEWFDVTVINVFDTLPSSDCAKEVYNSCVSDGVKITNVHSASALISGADIIIDAIFGVGFYGSIDKDSTLGKLILQCNAEKSLKIAIDTPSGVNSADGTVSDITFSANLTITMAFIKTGMLSYPAKEYCGDIFIADIGYTKGLSNKLPKEALIPDDEYIDLVIPKRCKNTNKGNFGRLLMYCGCENMTGAAILAAKAALRSGVGLLNIARNKETVRILQNHLIEPVFSVIEEQDSEKQLLNLSEKATAILTGCGLGKSEDDKNGLISLIKNANSSIIIDADGINLICENKLILREAKHTPILTPHPLEFARLTEKSVNEVQSNRINLARQFSKEYNCILVLKGASTVIAAPDGKMAINTSGNAGLSKGGSGDVLAGLIASFAAQGISAFDSAVSGVYLHGKAADYLKDEISEYGFLPSDLPMAIAKMLP